MVDRAHRCADELSDGNALKLFDPADELAAAASRGNIVAMIQQALENEQLPPAVPADHQPAWRQLRALRSVCCACLNPQGEEIAAREIRCNAAKDAGLAEKIDRWVILNSIKLLADHRSKGHNTRLFVHLSSASLQDQTLLPWLSVALKAARLPSDSLVVPVQRAGCHCLPETGQGHHPGVNELHCKIGAEPVRLLAEPVQHASSTCTSTSSKSTVPSPRT